MDQWQYPPWVCFYVFLSWFNFRAGCPWDNLVILFHDIPWQCYYQPTILFGSKLHTPMHFSLSHLSFLDLCFSSSVVSLSRPPSLPLNLISTLFSRGNHYQVFLICKMKNKEYTYLTVLSRLKQEVCVLLPLLFIVAITAFTVLSLAL